MLLGEQTGGGGRSGGQESSTWEAGVKPGLSLDPPCMAVRAGALFSSRAPSADSNRCVQLSCCRD